MGGLATSLMGALLVWCISFVGVMGVDRYTQSRPSVFWLGFSGGLIITVACFHLLPEALELGLAPQRLGHILLATVLTLTLIEWVFDEPELSSTQLPGRSSGENINTGTAWAVGISGFLHTTVDGIVLASAFASDHYLGWLAVISVSVHELPHRIADFVIFRGLGASSRKAKQWTAMVGFGVVLGAALSEKTLQALGGFQPEALAVAGSSFLFIAMNRVLPQVMTQKDASKQSAFLGLSSGAATVAALTFWFNLG